MTSLPDILEAYLKVRGGWHSKGDILTHNFESDKGTTYMSDTVSRKLRLLEEQKRIAVKYEGNTTLYKFIPEEMRPRYIRTIDRTDDKLFVMTT